MKALVLMMTAALSTVALAEVKTYKGTGEYRSTEQQNGAYSVEVSIEEAGQDKKKVKSVYTMTVNGTQETFEYVVYKKALANDFYELLDESQANVGDGYCVSKQSQEQGAQAHQVCHSDLELKGMKIEETAMIKGDKIYRIGSKFYNGKKTAWSEELSLVP